MRKAQAAVAGVERWWAARSEKERDASTDGGDRPGLPVVKR